MQLVYSEEELFSELEFASIHEISGKRLHGGLDADGKYLPPRANIRVQAIDAWTKALSLNTDQYIWRRRIQQYGPRLEKPYDFYSWVKQARKEIEERREKPVKLVFEPMGTEIAISKKIIQKISMLTPWKVSS